MASDPDPPAAPSRSRRRHRGAVVEHGPADRICPSCGSRNIAWRRYCAECQADLEPRSDEDQEVLVRSRLENAVLRSRDMAAKRSAARTAAAEAEASRKAVAAAASSHSLRDLPARAMALAAVTTPFQRLLVLGCGAMVVFAGAYYGLSTRRPTPRPLGFEIRAAAPSTLSDADTLSAAPPSLAGAPSAATLDTAAAGATAPSHPHAARRRHHRPTMYCHRHACVRRVPAWTLY